MLGFSIGLVLLFYFLEKKDTKLAYGPNSRVLKNISSKKIVFSKSVKSQIEGLKIDSLSIYRAIQSGVVIFSESNTKLDSCKVYKIQGDSLKISVENCAFDAKIVSVKKIN